MGALVTEEAEQGADRLRLQVIRVLQLTGEALVPETVLGELEEGGDAVRKERRAVLLLAPPEGCHGRRSCGGGHEDVVVGDAVDAPGLDAEGEGVTHRALPDELLVELTEGGAAALHLEVEGAAVGDGAAGHEEEPFGPGACGDHAVDAVDAHQGPEVAQARGLVAAGEHLQDQVELAPREVTVGVRGAHRVVELVDPPRGAHGHGHEHLGEDVEGVGDGADGLDVALERRPGEDRGFHEGPRVEGVEAAAAGVADAVAGAAEPLQGRDDAGRRLHHGDLVDGAHVDAELQGVRGDDGPESAALQALLHNGADLPREGAVVGVGELHGLARVEEMGHLLHRAL